MSKTVTSGCGSEDVEKRLEQARLLQPYLKGHMRFPAGKKVLEAGCGIGTETVILAELNPECAFVCVDLSLESVEKAVALASAKGLDNVAFVNADIHHMPFSKDAFDYCFFCFVLEHLPEPGAALREVSTVVRPNGRIRAIEYDHGTHNFVPSRPSISAVVTGMINLQKSLGRNACTGMDLRTIMRGANLRDTRERRIKIDTRDPDLGTQARDVLQTVIVPIYQSTGTEVLARQFAEAAQWNRGLRRLAEGAYDFSAEIYVVEASPAIMPQP